MAGETSPYLLQHAHNPVDWFPWGEEALQKARSENKPILVSIGYAACHWCHVMEKESFEDEATAFIMNTHFINIKIDREERPDLDHIYMDAVQVMTGSGGWPLNVFLTPECKPFYGGTYFPPRQAFNRPSWQDVLHGVAATYQEKPHEILSQAENLTAHLLQSNNFSQNFQPGGSQHLPGADKLHVIYDNLMKQADKQEGGFGKAPKFPQTFGIHYLLAYYHYTKKEEALQQACLSLDKMIRGGIYDQIGGGFARYATDRNWLVPHFEKMLYDNALLLMVLSEAWQLTHKDIYDVTIRQTIGYIKREMLSPEGGFYSALDADSEGVEGKFYVWQKSEVAQLLGDKTTLFCEFYDVTTEGNWEESNILHVPVDPETFAAERGMPYQLLQEQMRQAGNMLLESRSRRIRPLLDDKILLGWNALMNTAFCKAFAALGEESYREMAVRNMDFIWKHFYDDASGNFFHTYKNGSAKFPAFLDDYAYTIQALIHLQEITGDAGYLQKAQTLAEHVITNFREEETGLFFFTHKDQKDAVIRKKEIYDGAVPSGNSIMAWNLLYLEVVFDKPEWKESVVKMLNGLLDATVKYPTSFGVWAALIQQVIAGTNELVLTGENTEKLHKEILHIFMPNKVLQISAHANEEFPLLKGKHHSNVPLIFFCRNYACQAPVKNVNALTQLLDNTHAFY